MRGGDEKVGLLSFYSDDLPKPKALLVEKSHLASTEGSVPTSTTEKLQAQGD